MLLPLGLDRGDDRAMTDDQLILRPTGIDDDRKIDDFRVFFEGRPIGRISVASGRGIGSSTQPCLFLLEPQGQRRVLNKLGGLSGKHGSAFTPRSRPRTSRVGTLSTTSRRRVSEPGNDDSYPPQAGSIFRP
jgi:hypothetical protein